MNSKEKKEAQKSGQFAKDVLLLSGGTFGSQVITFLAMPIITRLYSPEEFGLASLFTSITVILVVFVGMNYESAIVLPKKAEQAKDLFAICIISTFLVSSATIPGFYFGGGSLIEWMQAPKLRPFLWLVPVALLISGIAQSLRFWNMRKRRFAMLSTSTITSALTYNSYILGFGFAGHATGGNLIIGNLIIALTKVIILSYGQLGKGVRVLLRIFRRKKEIIHVAWRYKKFPLVLTWNNFISRFSSEVPIILLAHFFSPAVVGLYALSNRVLKIPVTLVGNSISEVFFQRGAQSGDKAEIRSLVENLLSRIIVISIVPLFFIPIMGKDLIVVFLGGEWTEGGLFFQVLSFGIILMFIGNTFSPVFTILEKQEIHLLCAITLAVGNVGAVFLGGLMNDLLLTLLGLSLVNGLIYGGMLLLVVRILRVSFRSIGKMILVSVIRCFPFAVLLAVSKWLIVTPPIATILIASLLALVYYVVEIRRDEELKAVLGAILPKKKS